MVSECSVISYTHYNIRAENLFLKKKEKNMKQINLMGSMCYKVNLRDSCAYEAPVFLLYNLLPSLSGGELFDRIAAEDYKMSEAEVINYMRQACEGLKHMHENSIVHLDIKVCSTDRLVISLFEDGRLPLDI